MSHTTPTFKSPHISPTILAFHYSFSNSNSYLDMNGECIQHSGWVTSYAMFCAPYGKLIPFFTLVAYAYPEESSVSSLSLASSRWLLSSQTKFSLHNWYPEFHFPPFDIFWSLNHSVLYLKLGIFYTANTSSICDHVNVFILSNLHPVCLPTRVFVVTHSFANMQLLHLTYNF